MINIKSNYLSDFGSQTFDIGNLPSAIGEKLQNFFINNLPINSETAELIALEMKRWAISRGCTHYTHWFQPLTGLTAEKHNTFLQAESYSKKRIIEEFSASELIQGEPDASSFPHGGIRSTFEARGYSVWDPSSPSFIMETSRTKTLFIPSIFISFTGDVLDKKTPLLRSIKTLSEISTKILRLFGIDTEFVTPLIGPEQEYFLIPSRYIKNRLDLNILGYSLFGAKCPKGQKFQDHYFGSIKDNVLAFMQDSEETLIKLGVPVKTRHNEVAPNQFELAVLPEYCNIAADHNHLVMEVLRRHALKYDLTALFHEKPFFGVNGSGKHINWSLVTDRDTNIFDIPGKDRNAIISLLFISGLIRGIHLHNDLLRSVFACAGNDRRLGAHEAPPNIISLYLGNELTDVFENIESLKDLDTKLNTTENTIIDGLKFLTCIKKDNTDRNRTSPIAFTGNKFEFRTAGASQSIAFPNTVINLLMADSLHFIHEKMEKALDSGHDLYKSALKIIKDNYKKHRGIIYNGNTYEKEWHDLAEKRGLFIADSTPYALDMMISEKNIALFSKYNVLRDTEIRARYIVKQNIYTDTVETEVRIARDMIRNSIVPAVFKYQSMLAGSINSLPKDEMSRDDISVQRDYLSRITGKLSDLLRILKNLDLINERIKDMPQEEKPYFYADSVAEVLSSAQDVISKLEERLDYDLWPLSRYSDMFFSQ